MEEAHESKRLLYLMHSLFQRLHRKWQYWRRMPVSERGWFFTALPLLGLARLGILTLPFRWMAPLLGHNHQTAAFVPLASPEQWRQALAIGRGIRTAARYTPWESKCLAQAMVARCLLGLSGLPYGLYLGLRKEEKEAGGMAAHAWVCTGPVAVTGGHSFGQFTVVGVFASDPLRRSLDQVIPSSAQG